MREVCFKASWWTTRKLRAGTEPIVAFKVTHFDDCPVTYFWPARAKVPAVTTYSKGTTVYGEERFNYKFRETTWLYGLTGRKMESGIYACDSPPHFPPKDSRFGDSLVEVELRIHPKDILGARRVPGKGHVICARKVWVCSETQPKTP